MIQLARKALDEAVQIAERNAPPRATLELVTEPDALLVRGGGDAFYAEARLDADTSGELAAHLPPRPLRELLRSLAGDVVTLEAEGSEVILTCGHSRAVLTRTDDPHASVTWPDRYPLTFPAGSFARAVEATSYAAAKSEYQAAMRGLLLDVQGLACAVVATDGFRLARALTDLEGEPTHAKLVLPLTSALALAKLDAPLELAPDPQGGRLHVRAGHVRAQLALVDGTYPDYQRVLPNGYSVTITLDATELAAAVNRVAILADRATNRRIDLLIRHGRLTLASSGAYGSGREELELTAHEGEEELGVLVNASYLAHALAQVKGDAKLRFNGARGAFTVTPADHDRTLALIVPLKDAT